MQGRDIELTVVALQIDPIAALGQRRQIQSVDDLFVRRSAERTESPLQPNHLVVVHPLRIGRPANDSKRAQTTHPRQLHERTVRALSLWQRVLGPSGTGRAFRGQKQFRQFIVLPAQWARLVSVDQHVHGPAKTQFASLRAEHPSAKSLPGAAVHQCIAARRFTAIAFTIFTHVSRSHCGFEFTHPYQDGMTMTHKSPRLTYSVPPSVLSPFFQVQQQQEGSSSTASPINLGTCVSQLFHTIFSYHKAFSAENSKRQLNDCFVSQ